MPELSALRPDAAAYLIPARSPDSARELPAVAESSSGPLPPGNAIASLEQESGTTLRARDESSLRRAFEALQSAQAGGNRSALRQEPTNPARQATRAYQDTEQFLGRDELARLVGFDDYA